MPKAIYAVDLSDPERETLQNIIHDEKSPAKMVRHAEILLAADVNAQNPASSPVLAARFSVHRQTVQTLRKIYATQGLEAALEPKVRTNPPIQAKLTPEVQAQIIALCSSDPPPGSGRWTLRLVAEQAVQSNIVQTISHTSNGRILKKWNYSLR